MAAEVGQYLKWPGRGSRPGWGGSQVLDAPDTLAWKASGAVSREVEVTGTEMVRRRLLRRGLLSLADAAGGNASAGLKVKVAPRRNAGLPAQQVQCAANIKMGCFVPVNETHSRRQTVSKKPRGVKPIMCMVDRLRTTLRRGIRRADAPDSPSPSCALPSSCIKPIDGRQQQQQQQQQQPQQQHLLQG
ncbi:MAG: hypothetical protein FRX49_11089 [Trebouxia sp. A1-2]|nr:MAG: hypothetical protein FRX49_11089 [Trebouxia sp. A1-2]